MTICPEVTIGVYTIVGAGVAVIKDVRVYNAFPPRRRLPHEASLQPPVLSLNVPGNDHRCRKRNLQCDDPFPVDRICSAGMRPDLLISALQKEGTFQRRGAYSAQSKIKTTNDRSEKHATLLHVFLIMLQFKKGLLQRNTETL